MGASGSAGLIEDSPLGISFGDAQSIVVRSCCRQTSGDNVRTWLGEAGHTRATRKAHKIVNPLSVLGQQLRSALPEDQVVVGTHRPQVGYHLIFLRGRQVVEVVEEEQIGLSSDGAGRRMGCVTGSPVQQQA